MALHDTSKQRDTGGISPFAVSDSMDFNSLMEDGTIIDSAMPGQPGAVTIRRVAGRPLDPHAPLIDKSDPSSYVVAPSQPGVTVRVIRGDR